MLVLAAILHFWPLQPATPGARCYGSPLKLVDDHLPRDNNQSSMISDAWAFLDTKTSKPIAYLYGTYGYDTPDSAAHPGAFLQFTSFAHKGMREIAGINQLALQKNDPVPLTLRQLGDAEQHLIDDGLVLVGCFTGPYFINM